MRSLGGGRWRDTFETTLPSGLEVLVRFEFSICAGDASVGVGPGLEDVAIVKVTATGDWDPPSAGTPGDRENIRPGDSVPIDRALEEELIAEVYNESRALLQQLMELESEHE